MRTTQVIHWNNSKTSVPEAGKSYVMKGIAANKALDTYHLILAATHACNLRCKHCYLPDYSPDRLPENIALRLVDEWSEITVEERGQYGGIFHVKGGEPFVIPYLDKIIGRLAKLQSLRLMITTNGTFATPKILHGLQSCHDHLEGHTTIIVSLDGASASTHDYLRGEGQFDVTLGFLMKLNSIGIHTHLNCVLHDGNVHEVPDFINQAKDLGIEQINFLPLVPKGFGADLRTSQATHLQLHTQVQEAYDAGDETTKKLLAGSLSDIIAKEHSQGIAAAHECVAAYRGLFYITPEGSVFTCPNLLRTEHSIGNVHNTSLRELCDKLPYLYNSLRGVDSPSDRYICTGERDLYNKTNDTDNLIKLKDLQFELSKTSKTESSLEYAQTAYCISRNF